MNDLRKAIETAENVFKVATEREAANALWKAMDADYDLIKAHVAGYQRTTASGASVHVNDYENGRGMAYKRGAAYGKHHWDKGHIGGHDAALAHHEHKEGKKLVGKERENFIAGYKNSQNVEKIHEHARGDKAKEKEARTKVMWH